MSNKIYLFQSTFAGFCALAGFAHAGLAETVTLDDAVRYALSNNPALRAAGHQSAAASEARAAAEAGHWPRVDLQYLVRRSDNPLDVFADKLNRRRVNPATDFTAAALNQPDASTLHATELSLSLPLYAGGRIDAQAREASENEAAAQHRHRHARGFTVLRTSEVYFRAQAAHAALEIGDDALDAARAHADTTARLVRDRRIVASDKLTAEVNLAMIRSHREQAVSRRAQTLDQLKLAMGASIESEIAPIAWNDQLDETAPGDLKALEARALTNRADLGAQAALVAAARARVEQVRSAFKPQFGVMAGESWYDDKPGLDNSSTRVMGTLSINFYNGGRDGHQLAAARLAVDEQERHLEALRAQARAEVREAWQALSEARTRVDICADNIGKARDTVTQVRARYGEGRTILIDLLAAERTLVEARSEKLAATLSARLAAARLAFVTGGADTAREAP